MTRKKCKWTVWKTLEAIPEKEYERIGRTKPQLPVFQPGELDQGPK
jgi:prolyl-tRNA synthetase